MNGSPKNIQRDGLWSKPETALDLAWSTQDNSTATTQRMNSSGSVVMDKGNAHAEYQTVLAITTDYRRSIGVLIQQPEKDNHPYRVLASGNINGFDKNLNGFAIMVGYAPLSPTGSDDVIEDPYFIPFAEEFDGLIQVPHLVAGDTYFGRALAIGLVAIAGETVSAAHIYGQISVQNLGVKPPTMQNAVS